ncbi:glycosyltransferase family 4 protein [Pseudoalteromonas sp. SG44-17]|uniref:glycosyltransferase family 4 protein n=1 Tax=Pseudoalteromonas sp. SG44-17 TaxID=2760963 RepID=UPI0015FFFFE9|nr:glycosyltransferase family 4 protein [Pseudoalteromonas sp. SG44-17]MBB1411671.1 glycosyltransferase family 4 protein [Pseudoalteromonas sp. SG44-17]
MKLALIIDDYLPDSTRVGAKMFHELALELIKSGSDVTVITPAVGQAQKFIEQSIEGVKVWRFSSGPIKDVGKVARALNETLLSFRAWSAIRNHVFEDTFDGVIYYSPSIFFSGLVNNIKQRCNCNSYLVLRDLFPQWVIDAGMIKQGSLIARYFKCFEQRSYQAANTIGLMSEKNLEVFKQSNGPQYPTEILRNWADTTPVNISTNLNSIRKQLKLENKVIYFYGGNIGHAQDMANLMRLAKSMQHCSQAHFLFIGQGDEVELINQLAKQWQLTNYTYLPSVNQNEFKHILASIDVGLFSLSAKHTAHNFPGKLLGYMVQSLPILGSVNSGNDLQALVNSNKAGFISENGDDEKLLKNALALYENPSLRKQLGHGAYELLKNEFAVTSIAANIVKKLKAH